MRYAHHVSRWLLGYLFNRIQLKFKSLYVPWGDWIMMRSNLFRFLDTLDTDWFPCLGFLSRLAARARFAISTALWEFWLLFLLLLLGIPALAAVWPLGCLWVLFRLFGLLLPGFDIYVNGARIPLSGAIRRMIRVLLVVMSIMRGVLSVRLMWVK